MSSIIPTRKLLLTGASLVAAAAAVVSTPAAAQDAQQEDEESIVVTGTRIARPGFTSNSPIATIGTEELQLQQPVNIEETLRNQPQFLSGDGANTNNGSRGAATLDLRGLSPTRTLPLVDGHRMVGFDQYGLFDVSAIPLGLIKRVDVVTGGASAVYGSDAVAGVVNFILNEDFQGVEARYGHTMNDLHDTGDSDNAELTMGASFDDGRGNVALSLGWLEREAVYQVDGPASLAPGASSTTTPSAFDVPTLTRRQVDGSGNLVPFYQGFDFNGQNLYQAPQERWNATALARYQITPNVEAYSRFIFNSSTSAPQLASSGTFGQSFELPVTNPFLGGNFVSVLNGAGMTTAPCSDPTAGQCYTLGFRWRGVDVGPRQYVFEYDTFQTLLGLRGDLNDSWSWDLTYAYGETSLKRQQRNDIDSERLQQALFASSTTTCIDGSNGCYPLDIFNASRSPDPRALDFIRLNLQVQATTTQEYIEGVINGDMGEIHSPFATSPIGLSFGFNRREETTDYQPDSASQAGISPGFGATLPVTGGYDVTEFFGEALVPLVEDAPFADSINLELGYRTADYSISGEVEAYKYGADWTPMEGLRLRAMFQRAVRAPNLNELFQPFTPGTGDLLVDPCATGTPDNPATVPNELSPVTGSLYALCLGTGVPVGVLNSATLSHPTSGQINNFTGGNTDLVPETADTTTFGIVWQPPQVRGLTATLDYFNIEVNDAISVRPAFDIVDGCYNTARNTTADPNAADCLRILRNTADGSMEGDTIFGVDQVVENIGTVNVEGLDYSVSYDWDIGAWGTINVGVDGTHLLTTSYAPSPGAGEVDCLGYYGKTCGLPETINASVGGPVPEDRWVQRTTWSLGDWDLSYRWRHISGVSIDERTRVGGTLTGELDPDSLSIPDMDYIDLAASWSPTDVLRLTASVTNATGEDAPFVFTTTGSTAYNSGNTYPSLYDVLGRVVTLGVTAKF